MKRAIMLVATFAIVTVCAAQPAMACPVCFGATDSPMAEGVNNGILVLLGVIGSVQVGFVALFVGIRRRGNHLEKNEESLEAINGGAR